MFGHFFSLGVVWTFFSRLSFFIFSFSLSGRRPDEILSQMAGKPNQPGQQNVTTLPYSVLRVDGGAMVLGKFPVSRRPIFGSPESKAPRELIG